METARLRARCAADGLRAFPASPRASRGSILRSAGIGVQRVDECSGIERPQVADLLPYADESHRDLQLVTDPQHDAALGGAIELGEHDARDLHVGLERLG